MIGKTIRYFRTSRGIRQGKLAQKLEIDRTTLSGYESERRQPDFTTIEKIAKECDFTIYFMDNISGEKFTVKDFERMDV